MEVATLAFRRRFSRCVRTSLVQVLFGKEYYFTYNHQLLFVSGLALSRSLTEGALVDTLSWYLTSNGEDIVSSAIWDNARGFLSCFFMIIMAYAADSFIGRFPTLFISNIAYIGALMLLFMYQISPSGGIAWSAIILLALGTSGEYILRNVLMDFIADHNEARSIARAKIWFHGAYSVAIVLAILFVVPDSLTRIHSSWKISVLICFITMISTVTISAVGRIVDKGHVKKLLRCLVNFSRQGSSSKIYDIEMGKTEGVTLEAPALHFNNQTQEGEGDMGSYKREDFRVPLKSLILRMLPIYMVFAVVALISSAGSAFFLNQYSNLNIDSYIVVYIYTLVQALSKFTIPLLYWCICRSRGNEKVKIGVGIVCGIISCICAWQLEVHRLETIKKDVSPPLNFLWLFPQFCLLGCMEGLTEEGLLKFYKTQVSKEQLQGFREEYVGSVKGIGMLLNICLIEIVKGYWFGETINDSRLDKYYLVLVVVGSVNFVAYCCIARCLYKNQELANDGQNEDSNDSAWDDLQDDHVMEQAQELANDDRNQGDQDTGDVNVLDLKEQNQDSKQNEELANRSEPRQ